LPILGKPALVSSDIAATLQRHPTRLAGNLGRAWFLTDTGRQFLSQFRSGGSDSVLTVTVRFVMRKSGEPRFELLLDDGTSTLVHRTELQRRLQQLRAAHPDVRVTYDFRPAARAP
jgi:hypothetical protein